MTIEDRKKIESLISGKPAQPPERIYNWMNTQLSLARLNGGMTFQGHRYVIAFHEPDMPLVRADVIKREAQEALATMKNEAEANAARQERLF